MKRIVPTLALVLLAACGSEESFECGIADLTGAWRATFEKVDGNCPDLASVTVIMGPDGAPAECVENSYTVEADQCSDTLDMECPSEDGTTHIVGVRHQVSEDRLEGSVTMEIDSPSAGYCIGTYDSVITRQ